jgi:Winged helix DNA-binding domain
VSSGGAPISTRELNRATLARQGLLEPIAARGAAAAVERLGSLQAQHPEWPPFALAARAANARTANLAGALERRTVVRSSLMRITIHVVATTDLWPMFAVCQQMRLSQWRLLAKADPVDSPIGRRMKAAHEVALAALAERTRTSTELDRLLAAEAGPIDSPAQRIHWRHLAALVPMVHVPHDGEGYGRSRYAVAADWLGVKPPKIDLAEAHAHLARRYLAAFGPATIDDLVAYVGRGRGGIGVWRDAIAALGDEVIELRSENGRTLLDLESAPRPGADVDAPPRLLARWDSLLLSHAVKARDRVIDDRHRAAVFSKNADVLPTLLVDGMVAGTWELSRTDGTARIELRPFGRLGRADRRALEAEAERMLAIVSPSA